MAKVRIYYSTFIDVDIDAENNDKAIQYANENAYEYLFDTETEEIMENMAVMESETDCLPNY